MKDREPDNFKARTIIEISGECIETIPVGTEFIITYYNDFLYSSCTGLSVSLIYNNEFKLIEEKTDD